MVRPEAGAIASEELIDDAHYFRLTRQSRLGRFVVNRLIRCRQLGIPGGRRLAKAMVQSNRNWKETLRFLVQQKVSILHVHMPHWNALSVDEICQRKSIPWIYEVRGFVEMSNQALGLDSISGMSFADWNERESACCHRANHVVTLSCTMKEELIRRGIPKEKISVIPNGFDEAKSESWRGSKGNLRNEIIKRANGRPIIGMFGSAREFEGYETAILAIQELIGGGIDAYLLIVGDGPHLPKVKQFAGMHLASTSFEFVGNIHYSEIGSLYQCLSCYALPRVDVPVCRVVAPVKILEPMGYGVPVVASDLPVLREHLEHKRGLLARPDDPASFSALIRKVLLNADLRTSLSVASSNWIKEHRSWTNSANSLLKLYESLEIR